jgi:hypothetical protein
MPELLLSIGADKDADQQELAELTGWLRRELLELDVESVEPLGKGEAPPGAKGFEVLGVGALVVKLAHSTGMLSAVFGAVQQWLSGHKGRSVKIAMEGDIIEVTGISSSDQRRLIDAWIARHANQ